MTGIELIARERARQVEEEGWTAEHDDRHRHGELAQAAAVYALPGSRKRTSGYGAVIVEVDLARLLFPWQDGFYRPTPDDRVRELAKAGALIAAEIDRLQRRNDVPPV